MEKRKLGLNDIPKARKLWSLSFPDDSERFLDWFFETQFPSLLNWSIWENGNLLAALYAMPYTILCRSKTLAAPLILGVATDPGARNRGIMRMMMAEAHDELSRDYPASLLNPFDFAFYRKMSYAQISERLQLKTTPAKFSDYPDFGYRNDEIDSEQLFSIYRDFSKRFSCHALRSPALISRRHDEMRIDGGFCVQNDDAYAFIYNDEKQHSWIIPEFAYRDLHSARSLLSAIAKICDAEQIEVSLPLLDAPHDWMDDTRGLLSLEPFLMLKVLDLKKLLLDMPVIREVDICIELRNTDKQRTVWRIASKDKIVSCVEHSSRSPELSISLEECARWICGNSSAEILKFQGVKNAEALSFLSPTESYFTDRY